MAYLLDANVFIAAKNLHYGFDFCPAFWDWLVAGNESERVFSVEKVGDEVQAVGDELSAWAAARGDGFFLRPEATVFPAMAESQCLGQRPSVRAGSREHVPAGRRLLSRGAGSRQQAHGCNARSAVGLDPQGQDP